MPLFASDPEPLLNASEAVTRAGSLAVASLAVVWLLRRRLPTGVGEGVFTATLSVALLVVFGATVPELSRPAATALARPDRFTLATALAALSAFWFLVVVWVERERTPRGAARPTPAPDAQQRADSPCEALDVHRIRQSIGTLAAAAAGLAAAGIALGSGAAPGAELRFITLLLVLAIVAIGMYLFWRGPLAALTAWGSAAAVFAYVARPHIADVGWLRLAALVASAFALGGALAVVLLDRSRRQRLWLTRPAELAHPQPHCARVQATILATAVLGAAGALLTAPTWYSPIALWLAAVAALVVAHRQRWGAAGLLGLALICAGEFVAVAAWLPANRYVPHIGLAVAALHMLWLARFWRQQLLNELPWTTAGRLVPQARALAYACSAALFAAEAGALASGAVASSWSAGALLAAIALAWVIARDARERLAAGGAAAAALVLGSCVLAIGAASGASAADGALPMLAFAAALVLAVLLGRDQAPDAFQATCNALIGGVFPAVAVSILVVFSTAPRATHVLAGLACLAVAVGVRWLRAQSRPV